MNYRGFSPGFLKIKPKIVELPDGADIRAEVFLYGMIATGAKFTEEVVILSDLNIVFPMKQNIRWVSTLNKASVKDGQRRQKTSADRCSIKVVTHPPKKPRKSRANSPQNSVLISQLMKYTSLHKTEAYLVENEANIAYCIQNASDSEIGLKFLLETKLGPEKGNVIWEAIHKDFETIKKSMIKTVN